MAVVPAHMVRSKVRSEEGTCDSCRGLGSLAGLACDECDSTGRVIACPAEPVVAYLAVQGCDMIDSGARLESFVFSLKRQFSELRGGEQVAIWRVEEGGEDGPRVVAILHADRRGETVVRWL